MYRLGTTSRKRLDTCCDTLQAFVLSAIATSPIDFSVTAGYRCEEDQNAACLAGYSKAKFGQSPHNFDPSVAVDLVPWVDGKLVWDDTSEHWDTLLEHLRITASALFADGMINHNIENGYDRWGFDKPHWQLRNWKDLT